MRITICSSIDFSDKIKEVYDFLTSQGHQVDIPYMTEKIMKGEASLKEFLEIKDREGDAKFREEAPSDLIKVHYNFIKKCDAILVINLEKRGIKNYIGGNTFLEMGFAYTLEKPIYLLNPIPDMIYIDELRAMKPIILNGDLNKINN